MKIWKNSAAALAACLILTACYGAPFPVTEGTANARTNDSSVSSKEETPDRETHRSVARALSSRRVREDNGTYSDTLYDLTDFLGKVPGTLCAYALSDESHVTLLSLSQTDESAGDNSNVAYHSFVLDLTTGNISESVSWPQVINEDLASVTADESSSETEEFDSGKTTDICGSDYIDIVSADPLIVHDTMNAIIYMPQTAYETIVLPRYLADAETSVVNGQLYLTVSRGIVFEVQDDGTLKIVWTLPDNFGWLSTIENGSGEYLTFNAYDRNNEDTPVRIDLNPSSGNTRYYQPGADDSSYYSASSCGILASAWSSSEEAPSIFDTANGTAKTLRLPSSITSMLSSQSDDEAQGLSVRLSRCSVLPDWCCWSLSDSGGKPVRLYLWDTSADNGESREQPSETAYELPETISYSGLSSKAESLSDQYGVTIVLGDNVPSSFADYNVETQTDAAVIDGALSVLENVLSLYPDGYFPSLKGDYYRDIAIYLTGAMTPVDSSQSISNAGAFTTDENGVAIVALNLEGDLTPATVIHELDHVLNYRLGASGYLDENAWNSMNPSGFDYYYSYIDADGNSYQNTGSTQFTATGESSVDNIWFCDPYSKTFPMEDRARLMENLLDDPDNPDEFYESPHIRQKLTFYFGIIRNILDDGTWPEQTIWEKALSLN